MNIHETRSNRRRLLTGAVAFTVGAALIKPAIDDVRENAQPEIAALRQRQADLEETCMRLSSPYTRVPSSYEGYSKEPFLSYSSCKEGIGKELTTDISDKSLGVGVEVGFPVLMAAGGAVVVLKEFFNRRGRNSRRMPPQELSR